MTVFAEIIEKIKNIISIETGNRKVYDKDVSRLLKMSSTSLATRKSRNKIPYEEVLNFSLEYRVDANWLFFGIPQLNNEKQNKRKINNEKY